MYILPALVMTFVDFLFDSLGLSQQLWSCQDDQFI